LAREISLTDRSSGRARWVGRVETVRELLGRSAESGAIFGFLSVLIFFIITTWVDGHTLPQIIQGRSIASVMTNAASQGIIAVGVTMLMISGEFDLSVGSIMGLSALMFIIAADHGPAGLVTLIPGVGETLVERLEISRAGMGGVAAILVALTTGALLGFINGQLLVLTRIPSFIVTLGTLYIYRAIMLNVIPGGTIARYLRPEMVWSFNKWVIIALTVAAAAFVVLFLWPSLRRRWHAFEAHPGNVLATVRLVVIGAALAALLVAAAAIIVGYADNEGPIRARFFEIVNGQLGLTKYNFRSAIVWWFLTAAIFTVVLNHTRYGNAVFATGGNPEAARAQGINVRRVKVTGFVLSGTLAAVAGIMEASRFKVVEPLRGQGYELDVIAATVIGGTLLTGGYGSIIGSVLGILIAGMLKTGLVLIGVQADWFRGVLGIIMIAAVIINTNIRRQR